MEKGSINNFWSLNVYEVLVATQLKKKFNKKDYEVFFPVNAQSEGIDLILFNKKTKKSITLQVKGSKRYDPLKRENNKHGEGGDAAGFSVLKTQSKPDFFILFASKDCLVIPTNEFIEIRKKVLKFSPKALWLRLFFYTKDKSRKAEVQCEEKKEFEIDLSKYLNDKGWDLIKKKIK